MTTLVTVDAKIKADSVDAMRELLTQILPETRKHEGNHGIMAYLNEDGQSCLVIETWESRPHYEKYLQWRQANGSLDRIVALLEGPPTIRFFEAIDA